MNNEQYKLSTETYALLTGFATGTITPERIFELVAAGADVNASNNWFRTPLEMAAFMHSGEKRNLLIDTLVVAGADVNARDFAGMTVLQLAGDGDAIVALLKHGAELPDTDGAICELLSNVYDADAVAALVGAGANVNARDWDGKTALFRNQNADAVRGLIAAGADVNATSKFGANAIDAHITDVEILRILLANGATVRPGSPLAHIVCDMDLANAIRTSVFSQSEHTKQSYYTDGGVTITDAQYEMAIAYVMAEKNPSISFIQRKMGVGYNVACMLIKCMEHNGIISAPDENNRRYILD